MLPMISVITVNYNGLKSLGKRLFLECFHSILNLNTKYHNMEIIVVDNGSIDGSLDLLYKAWREYIDENGRFITLKVLRLCHNAGWSKAIDLGTRLASPDSRYYVFINNDIIATPNLLINLVANLESAQSLVAISPVIYDLHVKTSEYGFLPLELAGSISITENAVCL